MATLNLSTITIPAKGTQTPGKDSYNQEMFYGVLLDILALAKSSGFEVSDQRLIDIKTAIDGVSITVGAPDLSELKASIDSFSISVLAAAGYEPYE
jgi:hypothetical protein